MSNVKSYKKLLFEPIEKLGVEYFRFRLQKRKDLLACNFIKEIPICKIVRIVDRGLKEGEDTIEKREIGRKKINSPFNYSGNCLATTNSATNGIGRELTSRWTRQDGGVQSFAFETFTGTYRETELFIAERITKLVIVVCKFRFKANSILSFFLLLFFFFFFK